MSKIIIRQVDLKRDLADLDHDRLLGHCADVIAVAETLADQVKKLNDLVEAQHGALATTANTLKLMHTTLRRAASLDERALRSDARRLIKATAAVDLPSMPELPTQTQINLPALLAQLRLNP